MAFTTYTQSTNPRQSAGAVNAVKGMAQQASASNIAFIADKNAKKRWLCSVAEGVKLSKDVKNGINIDSREIKSQYELMVKLLKAETCDVIYFDCQLSASQIGILKMLQVFSNTELVHARLAMQFDRAAG